LKTILIFISIENIFIIFENDVIEM